MLVQVAGNLYTMVEEQTIQIQAGQTLRVYYSFSYKVAEATSIPVWGSLYQKTAGILNRVDQAQTKTTITLDKALDWQSYQGQIDIVVGSDMKAGIYGLIVELPDFENADSTIDDCIEITAAPGMTEWIGPLIMIDMMGMEVQMAGGMEEGMK